MVIPVKLTFMVGGGSAGGLGGSGSRRLKAFLRIISP